MPLKFDLEVKGAAALEGTPETLALRALHAGALKGAQLAQGMWVRFAQVADIRATGAYIAAIQSDSAVKVVRSSPIPQEGQPVSTLWEIVIHVVNNAAHAQIVEEGHGGFHLPSVVSWSSARVKQGKKGPYLSIPFRHRAYAAPGAREGLTRSTIKAMMPEHVYAEAKKLHYVTKKMVGPVHDQGGQFVAADRYAQPAAKGRRRLHRGETTPMIHMGGPGQSGPHNVGYEEHRGPRGKNPAWQRSKFEGLFKTGSKGHTAYMTVRTMTPRSQGWNVPAQRGHYLAEKVAGELNRGGFARAVTAGIKGALGAPEASQ